MTQSRHIVVHEWMLDRGLKGSELLAYALIWGFCQDGESEFHGSSAYVAHWCGISRQQAVAVLKKLTESGHIIKSGAPGYPAHYRISIDEGVKFSGVSNNLTGGVKLPDMGCQIPLPPAPLYNDRQNIDKRNIEGVLRAREDDGRKSYGVKVRMTPDEYAKIVSRYGADDAAAMVQMLDDYLVDHPRKHYANHYRAAIGWPAQRLAEQRTAEQRLKNAQEAGQRVNGQQQPYSGYGEYGLAASKRLEELLKQN